ncbi:hypothetical protein [Jeotgalibacillus soli]|uniref:Uncharacterized protein n=1 Tax=Jeotgalibacillus soli TaxID=889306 RepID=A0A0C2VH53_9BACL|nr:hypothetical protein [Jeotgalibacillus soli]KIL43841.1 hypothetical protein KP78_36650 [Jeotgalibacillus soli]
MRTSFFHWDDRLQIELPGSIREWEARSQEEKQLILFHWEKTRGRIPDKIMELDQQIMKKQRDLSDESDFDKSCRLNEEIADLASIINDLWIWYRIPWQLHPAM